MNFSKRNLLIITALALFIFPAFVVAQTDGANATAATANTAKTSDATDSPETLETNKISEEAKIESVRTLSDSVKKISDETKATEIKIRAEVKNTIDSAVRDTYHQTDTQAYKIRNVINTVENRVTKQVRDTITGAPITDTGVVDELEVQIESAVDEIETTIESEFGSDIDTSENMRSVKETLLRYRELIEENRRLIEERAGDVDLVTSDTDGDGLSDYDETYIFDTDPKNAFSTGDSGDGARTDGEKVAAGINPTNPEGRAINYADPRADREAHVSEQYNVSRVELIESADGHRRVSVSGTAIPNSYITVYVFSTPIIVTVKTDQRGEWEYTFDQELDDGEHNIYVATVDNSGRLVARSNAIPFTKTAEAAAIGSFDVGSSETADKSFVEDNFVLIATAILLAAILLTLIFTGNKKSVDIVVDEDANF